MVNVCVVVVVAMTGTPVVTIVSFWQYPFLLHHEQTIIMHTIPTIITTIVIHVEELVQHSRPQQDSELLHPNVRVVGFVPFEKVTFFNS